MPGKEASVTPETYSSGHELYDYGIHPKYPMHIKKYFKLAPVADFCRRLESKRKPARVLDLGSGVGVESATLIDTLPNAQVFSLDISTEGCRTGRTAFGLNQIQADIGSLPFGRKSFDAIHCKDVLVHIPNKDKFFADMARILKRHGLLLLISSKKAWTEYAQFEWTPEQVIVTARHQGFELISLDIKNVRTEDWYEKPKDRAFLMFRRK